MGGAGRAQRGRNLKFWSAALSKLPTERFKLRSTFILHHALLRVNDNAILHEQPVSLHDHLEQLIVLQHSASSIEYAA